MELSKENRNSEQNLHVSGLGGWLILAQIGLCGTFLSMTINIFFNILPIFRTGQWEELTDAASLSYNRLWPIIIPYELAGSIVLLGALIFAFVLFYRKKRKLPLTAHLLLSRFWTLHTGRLFYDSGDSRNSRCRCYESADFFSKNPADLRHLDVVFRQISSCSEYVYKIMRPAA